MSVIGKAVTFAFLFSLAQLQPAIAQTPAATENEAATKAVVDAAIEKAVAAALKKKEEEEKNASMFQGIKFGVGLSATFAGSKNRKRIENAEVVNGVVRITDESPSVARVLLETHFLFENSQTWGQSGHGPFVALQPGTNDVINAIGLGWMIAFRKDKNAPASWNIGAGLLIEPKVKVLGDGISANEPLPAGETQIRFKNTSRYGIFVMSSYTF